MRRVVFGAHAAGDHELNALMTRLRARANWAWLAPPAPRLRRALLQRIDAHIRQAEADSLTGAMRLDGHVAPRALADQVPQWLFAFDAAAIATFRALALLASHPPQLERVRRELADRAGATRELPYLRACVLESVRLWPTTPLVLRETTRQTVWDDRGMPARTGVIVFAPFFHRDDRRLSDAHRFSPELWLDGRPEDLALVPFSDGPAACPGRPVVLLLSTAFLASLLAGRRIALRRPARLNPAAGLPGTLNHFTLRFDVSAAV